MATTTNQPTENKQSTKINQQATNEPNILNSQQQPIRNNQYETTNKPQTAGLMPTFCAHCRIVSLSNLFLRPMSTKTSSQPSSAYSPWGKASGSSPNMSLSTSVRGSNKLRAFVGTPFTGINATCGKCRNPGDAVGTRLTWLAPKD